MPEQRTCLKNLFARPSSTDGWVLLAAIGMAAIGVFLLG